MRGKPTVLTVRAKCWLQRGQRQRSSLDSTQPESWQGVRAAHSHYSYPSLHLSWWDPRSCSSCSPWGRAQGSFSRRAISLQTGIPQRYFCTVLLISLGQENLQTCHAQPAVLLGKWGWRSSGFPTAVQKLYGKAQLPALSEQRSILPAAFGQL